MGDQGHRPRKSRSRGRAKRGKGKLSTIDPNNAKDMGLVSMAIRKRFPMTRRIREKVVFAIDKALDNVDPNVQMAAVRAGIMAERTNIAAEKLPAVHNHLHVHAPGTTPIEDADYIESTAQRLAAIPVGRPPDHEQPGGNGVLGKPGPVVSAQAPVVSQPDADRSGRGKAGGERRRNGHK